ncbi:MAG: hypothetical protein ACM3MF_11630 [Anaerolineae bacterium]
MSRRLIASLVALFVALWLPASALAQEYYFRVDREIVDVTWNADGTESIEYTFTFTPQPGSHSIDFVDVGMPNDNFDMSTASADVNGNPVSVSRSDYQASGSGFAVVLGSSAIQPGQTGNVHVLVGRVSNVLHPDTDDNNYASAVFKPTYFGSQYVTGDTELTVRFHLPPGVKENEPKYHPAENWPGTAQPEAAVDDQGRITYTWFSSNASASASDYQFGASFPKSYVPAGAIVTAPAFDFTGIIGAVVGNLGTVACCGLFAFMFVGMPVIGAIQGQRRKLQYIPPRIGIEGHGIKRGLTAVEAAILMEQPLDKVMTMTLFGLVKKGAATVVSRDPLKVQSVDPLPAGLHDYEVEFLKAIQLDDARARQAALQTMMVGLVKSVGEKMKGFSRKETQDYYKNVMEQAWAQVEAAQTPEVKGQKFDENLEWTMLDRDYIDRSRRVFTGPIFVPMLWGNYDPSYRPISTGTHAPASFPTSTGSGRGSSALPGADLAASVVGGVQSFSNNVLGNLNSFTSRVTNQTNPPPPPSRSSYRGGGGGHSCACACACAGCACACAGGGR